MLIFGEVLVCDLIKYWGKVDTDFLFGDSLTVLGSDLPDFIMSKIPIAILDKTMIFLDDKIGFSHWMGREESSFEMCLGYFKLNLNGM